MRLFANLKIGKKLAVLVGIGVVEIALVAGLGVWTQRATNALVEMDQLRADLQLDTERVANMIARVSFLVGEVALHDRPMPDRQAKIVELRGQYVPLLSELRNREPNPEAKRLVGVFEESGATWRKANIRVLEASQAGKYAEATRLFRDESMPLFSPMQAAASDYLKWQDREMEQIDVNRKAYQSRADTILVVVPGLALALAVFVGIALSRSISRPLGAALAQIESVAGGDVSKELDQSYLERADEFGDMARAIRKMSGNLRDVIKQITSGVQVLSHSSSSLSANSSQMSMGCKKTSDEAHTVAAAAEEMTANVTSVAVGMEQTTTNLANVVTHTDQMTSTIGEIAANSEKARHITQEANQQAARITEQMNQLGVAASQIGKVTETITEISSQTNLLALNATIEAARAGAAGKGFAVVATEIKELAQQTAAATEDIKARIEGVQSSSAAGIAEIERVSAVIQEVSDIVSSIAAAIEEQATVTKEISRNIAEASVGVKDANGRVFETSQASKEIAKEILVVDQAAGEMAHGSEQVKASATELSQVAVTLKALVERFHV